MFCNAASAGPNEFVFGATVVTTLAAAPAGLGVVGSMMIGLWKLAVRIGQCKLCRFRTGMCPGFIGYNDWGCFVSNLSIFKFHSRCRSAKIPGASVAFRRIIMPQKRRCGATFRFDNVDTPTWHSKQHSSGLQLL